MYIDLLMLLMYSLSPVADVFFHINVLVRFQNFYELGEREALLAEVSGLRDQVCGAFTLLKCFHLPSDRIMEHI